MNLGKLLWNRGGIAAALDQFKRVAHLADEPATIDMEKHYLRQESNIYSIIINFIDGKYADIPRALEVGEQLQFVADGETNKRIKFINGYNVYLSRMYAHYINDIRSAIDNTEKLIVIGDSHALSVVGVVFDFLGKKRCAHSRLIAGIKMWHVGQAQKNEHRACLAEQFTDLPTGEDLLICIGEIDCRPDEGIWVARRKRGGALNDFVANTVAVYLRVLAELVPVCRPASVTIQGIPAPAYLASVNHSFEEVTEFLSMIAAVNRFLEDGALANGWNFLDVYAATRGEDGVSHRHWHLDGSHLKPGFYRCAEQWLKRPPHDNPHFYRSCRNDL